MIVEGDAAGAGMDPAPVRTVSLIPSATETLVAWATPPIACTRFCEQPDLPTVGGTKNPDIDAILALAPDVVVMCPEENRLPDAEALRDAGLHVHICSPRTVDEVDSALSELAGAVGASPPTTAVMGATERPEPLGVRAFVPIWRRPWMTFTGDTYGSSVLAAIGVTNIAADRHTGPGPGGRYPTVDLSDIATVHPDVILAPSEPYVFREAHLAELREIAPTIEIDGQDLFWWGVRTPRALVRLRTLIAGSLGR